MKRRKVSAPRRWLFLALPLTALLSCSKPAEENQNFFDPKALVPAGGIVTLNGMPLAGAVLTFLPESGLPGVGETDEEGRYALKTIRSRGILPGRYKVAISYLVSADGEPQDLAARNATFPSHAMITAKEQLPPEYSDLFRTKHVATVTARGATALKFDIKAAISIPVKGLASESEEDFVANPKDAEPEPKKVAGREVPTEERPKEEKP